MTVRELLDELIIKYECKNLTEFCERFELSYDTISKYYQKNAIPKRGYTSEYLYLLLEHKKVLNKLEEFEQLKKILNSIKNSNI